MFPGLQRDMGHSTKRFLSNHEFLFLLEQLKERLEWKMPGFVLNQKTFKRQIRDVLRDTKQISLLKYGGFLKNILYIRSCVQIFNLAYSDNQMFPKFS